MTDNNAAGWVRLFEARFLLTWPGGPNLETQAWASLQDLESSLRVNLEQSITRRLGAPSTESVRVELFYRRGSVELLLIASALITAVSNYGAFRQGMDYFRGDVEAVTRLFFPNAQVILEDFVPGPAVQQVDDVQKPTVYSAAPQGSTGPLLWYLVLSHGAMILLLTFLLVWVVALRLA